MSDSPPRIRVINPNSNEDVTRGLDAALEPLRFPNGPEIVCSTLAEGPFGIETKADVESVVMPLRRMVEADNSSDAFVIACYSDPGLHVCREGTARPVFGIAECSVLTALARAGRFGVIAISQRSIARHRRYLLQMGLTDRLAGERPLEMSVAETASGEHTLRHMIDVGRQLKEQDRAETVIMGCAGMARHRRPLEEALGEPHLKEIAPVPGDRALADRNDAEAARARERGEHAAFGDAEYRPRGALAADVQPRIAVARDHEGVGRIVRLDHAPQRHHHAFDVGLGLDAERTFREGGTHDLRTVWKPQRLQCRVETAGDVLIGIRIDDANSRRRITHGCSRS